MIPGYWNGQSENLCRFVQNVHHGAHREITRKKLRVPYGEETFAAHPLSNFTNEISLCYTHPTSLLMIIAPTSYRNRVAREYVWIHL